MLLLWGDTRGMLPELRETSDRVLDLECGSDVDDGEGVDSGDAVSEVAATDVVVVTTGTATGATDGDSDVFLGANVTDEEDLEREDDPEEESADTEG